MNESSYAEWDNVSKELDGLVERESRREKEVEYTMANTLGNTYLSL